MSQHYVGRSGPLWHEVASSLVRRIVAGEFDATSMLPPEAALAKAYGVSRLSVREALRVLQEKGLVRIQHGIGAVVQAREHWGVLDPDVMAARLEFEDHSDRIFDEITAVRIALESEMARLAAQHIDDSGRSRLQEQIARMDGAAEDPDAYLELDLDFHDLIMRLSGNRTAHAVMLSIAGPLRQSRRITNRIPDGVRAAQDFHREIAVRISDGDPDGAAAAMREHLQWSWERYRNGTDTTPPR